MMKTVSLSLASLIFLSACGGSPIKLFPSGGLKLPLSNIGSYARCEDPACSRTAREITPPPSITSGTPFAVNNALDFVVTKDIDKVHQREDKFIVEFKDNSKLASREVDIDKLKLHDILITTYDFFQFVFLKSFDELKESDPSRGLLSSVKTWKHKVAKIDHPNYYSFGSSIAFCFQRDENHHQIIVVSRNKPDRAIAIDLLGFSNSGFKNMVASLNEVGGQ